MNRAFITRLLLFLATMFFSLSLWAGRPLPQHAVPAELPVKHVSASVQGSPMQAQAHLARQTEEPQHAATIFLLGMSLLLLIPVGMEWVAPHSVGRAFGYRRSLMQRRALP